nr:hypothetical protein Iba_scaffold32253CG0010 [Ipomoea batatas]
MILVSLTLRALCPCLKVTRHFLFRCFPLGVDNAINFYTSGRELLNCWTELLILEWLNLVMLSLQHI